jgi:hypothetical protein
LPRRGAKRGADVTVTETQLDAAAQRDAKARVTTTQEETRGPGAILAITSTPPLNQPNALAPF